MRLEGKNMIFSDNHRTTKGHTEAAETRPAGNFTDIVEMCVLSC